MFTVNSNVRGFWKLFVLVITNSKKTVVLFELKVLIYCTHMYVSNMFIKCWMNWECYSRVDKCSPVWHATAFSHVGMGSLHLCCPQCNGLEEYDMTSSVVSIAG